MNTIIKSTTSLRSRALVASRSGASLRGASPVVRHECSGMSFEGLTFGGGVLGAVQGLGGVQISGDWSVLRGMPTAPAQLTHVSANADHNSISNPIHAARVRTAAVPGTDAATAAVAGVDAYAVRKQGSPPRGEPR